MIAFGGYHTEMVEFAALPFPFSINIKFGHFTSKLCARTVKKFAKKRHARAELV